MIICQNCQQSNDNGQNYCRQCGAPLPQLQLQPNTQPPPKPYGWASPSSPLHHVAGGQENVTPQQVQPIPAPKYQPPAATSSAYPTTPQQYLGGYRCPRCGTNALPIVQKKISDGGWVVFVVMLLFCFPLFFIGLLMREEYRVCPTCLAQIG